MPAQNTDRNLLFGILALQNNFIDRETLLAAFAAWVVDKQRPLGEILCERGKLTHLQNELLRALTEQHVKQHGNNPEQSLAVVSSVGSLQEELRNLGDPQLEASLAAIAQNAPADLNAANIATTCDWGGTGQRFRVLRPHAKGGLGEVFVAQDMELHREVALKEIQSRFADQADSRSRFVLEAEITGGLEHPGIVPVYGLGQYADGRPFYAMRFIRGDSLAEAIARFHKADVSGRDPGERTLELRKLLGRFIDVCEAIEYAHSRGVLHRDLKPGNVMLGKYGETLVVDWGLAKSVGRGERATETGETTLQPSSGDSVDPTLMGKALGTPAYMSPEQAAGRINDLGPASDVYSLGATLYCLLIGQPPFSGKDHGEILRQVQQGEFPPPREVKPQVPAPLQAICLKAMSLKPTERYLSPKMLANDIEHWLADEPVSCLAEPLTVRAQRWVKHHPTLVVGTAATVLVSLVSLATIAAVVGQSNRSLAAKNTELDRKNTELEQANQRERSATSLAKENARQAQANATKAEQNATVAREQTQLALKSLESVIFDIQRKLANVPGSGDLRRALLQTALARLQKVSDQFASRSAIDRTTHIALTDLGDVFLRIGSSSPRPGVPARREGAGASESQRAGSEGSSGNESDGPLAAARRVYQQAFDIAQMLAAAAPNDARAQRDLSGTYGRLGDVQLQSGQVTEALGSYQETMAISQKLAAADPSDARAQNDLSISLEKLAEVSLRLGKLEDARDYFERKRQIDVRSVQLDPHNAKFQRDLSVSYHRLGDVQLGSGQVTEALGSYQKAFEIKRKLAAADPSNAQAQRDLSVSYGILGDMQHQSGQVSEALRSYQKALEIDQKLAAADPNNDEAQRHLSTSYAEFGKVQYQSGQVSEALRSYQKALEIDQKLAAADPSNAQAQRDLSTSMEKVGNIYADLGELTKAYEQYNRMLSITKRLAEQDPKDSLAQLELSITYSHLGDMQSGFGQVSKSLRSYQQGLEITQKLAAAQPTSTRVQSHLGALHVGLGDVQLRFGQVTEALGSYQKKMAISQKLAAADPSDARAQRDLAVSYSRLGNVQLQFGKVTEAMDS